MSSTDNWQKIYHWWQDHVRSHFNSSTSSSNIPSAVLENEQRQQQQQKRTSALHRRLSLMSFRSSNKANITVVKKRASFGGVEQYQQTAHPTANGGFRHVRDSLRIKNSRMTRTTTPTTAASVMNNKRSVH